MFVTNLKFAFRNLRKYKVFSFINLSGLIIGITASLLIFMYVINELSYENIHENADRIYRVNVGFGSGNSEMKLAGAMSALAPAAETSIPDVEAATRYKPIENVKVSYGEKEFKESKFFYADTSFFKIFTFPIVKGNSVNPLSDPYSLVITESTAEKIFGNKNPIGKVLKCGTNNLIVKAVAKDIPLNTQVRWDYVAPFSLYEKSDPSAVNWQHFGDCYTYLLVKNSNSDLGKKLNNVYADNAGKQAASFIKLYPQKLTDIYLHSEVFGELGPTGNITYIYLFSSVAVLILLIACFNFMNLSTARSINRSREVGVKKVLGAHRYSLIRQFLTESFMLTGIAVISSAVLYGLLNPLLSNFLGYNLAIESIYNFYFYVIIISVTFITGLFSGIYPAFVLSRYKPITTLKGTSKAGSAGASVRKVLVVMQFAISIFLIVGTLSIFKQINFMKNADLGFDKSNLVLINFPASSKDGSEKYQLLKDNLLQNTSIKDVSGIYTLPGVASKEMQTVKLSEGDASNGKVLRAIGVDYDFVKTLGIHLIAGRSFSEQFQADQNNSVILNESAVKYLNLKNPVGASIYIPGGSNNTREAKIVGVVRDFNISSLKNKIDPYFLYINPARFFTVAVKLSADQSNQAVNTIKSEWAKIFPDRKIDYNFMTDTYQQLYSSEEKLANLFSIFSLLAIFVACLGLFGLSAFTAELKTKEIGIRKVLGADVANISLMLSKQFVKWVLIANIFAWPLAGFAVKKWLEDFAYRINLSWELFVIASAVALFVSLLAISIQIIKAAVANPVDALRYE